MILRSRATNKQYARQKSCYYHYHQYTRPYHEDAICPYVCVYLTIRLFALDFYRVIVDEGAARVNYRTIEIESE